MHLLVKCTACGEDVEGEPLNDHFPVKGFVMPWEDFGYYGGFTDTQEDLNTPPSQPWIWCHDCIVKLLQTFPLLAKTIPPGGHHCDNDIPCCNWAWRATDKFGKYETDENNKFVPIGGAHYQIAVNGVWIDKID